MADDSMVTFDALLSKTLANGNPEFLRQALLLLTRQLMEMEVTQRTGATKHERSEDRTDYRNGHRQRRWDTRAGTLDLAIPKLRKSGYIPAFLEPRRRGERALVSVIQEAYVAGVSTRKVEGLLHAMGLEGISKSEVSRACEELDAVVQGFRSRSLESRYPYLWLDARYEKVRIDSRVVSNAVVIAYGVKESGEREVLGADVGPSEDEAFWTLFLRSLVERGLAGVQLVISDAHGGLKKAIATVLSGASWQRCRVHFMRNMLSTVPKKAQPLLSATLTTIFAQPTQQEAREQIRKILPALARHHARTAQLLEEAAEDIIAYMAYPTAHWRQIHSTNPLERLNREIKRRTAVVGIFPNRESLLRLVGMLLIEQNDEWAVGRRYFSQQSMAQLYESQTGSAAILLEGGDNEAA